MLYMMYKSRTKLLWVEYDDIIYGGNDEIKHFFNFILRKRKWYYFVVIFLPSVEADIAGVA